jgi:oxygen-independent coproporphyrinogen III oxidase
MSRALPLAAEPIAEDPYVGYAYSYPHKSAYGPLTPPAPLAPLWQAEARDALFLYLHVPFCEMRCGFCNLFARAGGDGGYLDAYLEALERQARCVSEATAGARRIVRMAIGGGTPTYLEPRQLGRLFDLAERWFDASPKFVPTSVETSPKTATADRLAVLRERGVERVSIGVQSFLDAETHAIGRPQSLGEVHAALGRLREFPVLNIDLIYGQPTQTMPSWLSSLRTALEYRPEELYLYPLYVRPATGIGRHGKTSRLAASTTTRMYREARELLLGEGYEPVSMRFFRRPGMTTDAAPVYCCQTDGMLGLGCGARSYTTRLHYSSPFAVESAAVAALIDAWIRQDDADFRVAKWGCRLSEDDRRRRFLLQSLLTAAGVDERRFESVFGTAPLEAFPVLHEWTEIGLVDRESGTIRLTPLGLERSDAIGPSLYAPGHQNAFRRFATP